MVFRASLVAAGLSAAVFGVHDCGSDRMEHRRRKPGAGIGAIGEIIHTYSTYIHTYIHIINIIKWYHLKL